MKLARLSELMLARVLWVLEYTPRHKNPDLLYRRGSFDTGLMQGKNDSLDKNLSLDLKGEFVFLNL